jgi:hypothetical protein
MAFSKSFPRTIKGSNYPRWEEIFISEQEEAEEEQKCRIENIRLIKECIEDAKKIFEERNLKRFQTDLIRMSIALFEKRASHSVYWKESKAKEKFDKLFSNK